MTETARLTALKGGYKDYLGVSVAFRDDTVVAADKRQAYVFARPPSGWAGSLNESSGLSHPSGLDCGANAAANS